MKKFFLILMLILGVFALVSCEDPNKEPGDEDPIIEEPIEEEPEIPEFEDLGKANVGTQRKIVTEETGLKTYYTSNANLATVDAEGVIEFLQKGTVVITENVEDGNSSTFIIEIVDEILIDANANEGDTKIVNGLKFVFGEKLFSDLVEAEDILNDGTQMTLLTGVYEGDLKIGKNNVAIKRQGEVTLKGKLTLDAEMITIKDLIFEEKGSIHITSNAKNVSIENNTFRNLSEVAITAESSNSLQIIGNTFDAIDNDAITVLSIHSGYLRINKNKFESVKTAVSIEASSYDETAIVNVERNEISDAMTGFIILLQGEKIPAIVRFNSLENYHEIAAKSNLNSDVDFTLNYWGMEALNLNDFVNIPEMMLIGHYKQKADIVSEASYNPNQPLAFFITNPVEELYVRDTYQLEWVHLPYELPQANVQILTSKQLSLKADQTGKLEAVRSGLVTITIRSTSNNKVRTDIDISVITDPGIDITPETKEQTLIKGDSIKLNILPFPYTLENEALDIVSLQPNIATVDETGLVTSINAGDVTIRVSLKSDPFVFNEYTLSFYESLDENNLLDLLTMYQVHYSKLYTYTVTGIGDPYIREDHESVSKFYFENLEIQEILVPLDQEHSSGTRGGQSRPAVPADLPTYNAANIYWIVVHDTAVNTHAGSAAYYAQYLVNKAMSGPEDFTSWNYTIDDKDTIRHIPEEEVAWHAGDGSTLPGQGAFLGGGNRNGIGIETSVTIGTDIYRTWQRTAKFAGDALVRWNLPRTQVKFHRDFSGKNCPQTLIASGLMPYFEQMVDVEYKVAKNFQDAEILFESHNLDLLDNHGRIIGIPDVAQTVSYTVTVTFNGVTQARTFYTHIPGSIR